MKKRLLSSPALRSALVGVFILFGTSASIKAESPPGSHLPQAKQQEWRGTQQKLLHEYDICKEHCGTDKNCLERCEKVYKSRQKREYQKLLHESGVLSVQTDLAQHPSCPCCGMDRAKFAHSRLYLEYHEGSTFGLCSLHCAAKNMAANKDKSPKTIGVGDYNTKKLINAKKAFWVMGGSKPGVMTTRAKWAFETEGDAKEFIRKHGGKLSTFEEVLKASYEDAHGHTKMMHEKHNMTPMKKMESDPSELEKKWGVKPLSIRLTAADHFVDFRYRVTDSEKASSILRRREKAYLLEQETGNVFPVPVTKLGPLRGTAIKPKANTNYLILFANVNKTIKRGSKVTVVIGDFRAENLTVE